MPAISRIGQTRRFAARSQGRWLTRPSLISPLVNCVCTIMPRCSDELCQEKAKPFNEFVNSSA